MSSIKYPTVQNVYFVFSQFENWQNDIILGEVLAPVPIYYCGIYIGQHVPGIMGYSFCQWCYWWTGGACALLIGQESNRRVSTTSEWILTIGLILYFLTFLVEFMKISFDAPALKVADQTQNIVNNVPTHSI